MEYRRLGRAGVRVSAFMLGDQSVLATAGAFVFVPRDVAHGFENTGSTPGRLLGLMTPGGFEKLFVELSQLPPGPPDPTRMGAILARYVQESSASPRPGGATG